MTSTTTTRLWGALMGAMVVVILYGVWVTANDDSDDSGNVDVITTDDRSPECIKASEAMDTYDQEKGIFSPDGGASETNADIDEYNALVDDYNESCVGP